MQSKRKIYTCPFVGCSSTFNRPYRLAQHRLVHINVKPFACQEENCSKAYTSKSHLDRHFNSVHRKSDLEILYCCPICMKNYANRQNLKRHMKLHHSNNKRTFICDYCSTIFRKKHQLRAHMYLHTGIRAFRCQLCWREYVTLAEKKKHMRNHKVYQCEHCELKFNRWSDLVVHRRHEHQTREFICHDCGKVFKTRVLIIRHVKKHKSNIAAAIFFCPYENCERHYSRNSNLKQHIRVKHKGLTFDCQLCGAKLSTKAKLNEHVDRHSRPEVILRVPKTIECGRKSRKDKDSSRVSSALKIAGIVDSDIIGQSGGDNCSKDDDYYINMENEMFGLSRLLQ